MMPTPVVPVPGSSSTEELEAPLTAVEQILDALGEALRKGDGRAIDPLADELHRALAEAVTRFSRAASGAGVPPPLRQRLARAGGQVAALRESLARATATMDQAIELLLPQQRVPHSYSARGYAARPACAGVIEA